MRWWQNLWRKLQSGGGVRRRRGAALGRREHRRPSIAAHRPCFDRLEPRVLLSADPVSMAFETLGGPFEPLNQAHEASVLGNTAPVVRSESFTVGSDGKLTIGADKGLLINDSDADGDKLTARRTSGTRYGNLSMNSDGSFTYRPDAGYVGSDRFTYKISDGKTESAEYGWVSIEVTAGSGGGGHDDGGNRAPIVESEDYVVAAGGKLTISSPGLLGNDSDPDGDRITAVRTSGTSHGKLAMNSDGSFTYQPDAGFTGSDRFTYRVYDGQEYSDFGWVGITVGGTSGGDGDSDSGGGSGSEPNAAPVGRSESYNTAAGSRLTINSGNGVLDNDTDPDGDRLTAVRASGPRNGNIRLNDDGSFTYTPDAGFTGNDVFTYRAFDGQDYSEFVWVGINVGGDDTGGEEPAPAPAPEPEPEPEPAPSPSYSSTYGWGLVDAGRAVAKAVGKTNFANVSDSGQNWAHNMMRVPEVWAQGYTGQGVTVAVIDTGVDYRHNDLNDNIWVNTDEIAGNGRDDDGNGYVDDRHGYDIYANDADPSDEHGHGTMTAGIIGAENNGQGSTGIAYDAKIMPVRVLGADGRGGAGTLAEGIRYAVDNGADVISISIAFSYDYNDLQSAVNYAVSKGVVVVSGAGNSGGETPVYPAGYASSAGLAVGAINSSYTMPSWSNRSGSEPMDYVLGPTGVYTTTRNNGHGNLGGTSASAPTVAGLAALLVDARGSYSPSQIESIIVSTARGDVVRVA